jgi:hypothetical protein
VSPIPSYPPLIRRHLDIAKKSKFTLNITFLRKQITGDTSCVFFSLLSSNMRGNDDVLFHKDVTFPIPAPSTRSDVMFLPGHALIHQFLLTAETQRKSDVTDVMDVPIKPLKSKFI